MMNKDGEKARILRERARALAREAAASPASDSFLEVIEFGLAHERYALEAASVREVYPLKSMTPLPCTPAFIAGLVSVRGRIFPVINLKKFFDLPEEGITDLHWILIIHRGDMEFGILADSIGIVRNIPLENVQPSLPTLTGIRAEYLKGVTAERLVILDIARILSDPRIVVQEEVEV